MTRTAHARAERFGASFKGMVAIIIGGAALPAGAALGQYASDFEAMAASSFGEVIWGQDSFYNPVPDSLPGLVYTYAGNTLELPPNPTGGDNFVGSTGGDPAKAVPFSRAQRDIAFGDGTGAWTISFDFAVTFVGTLPAFSINAGSFSLQPSGTNASFIALPRFPSVDDTSSFGADMVWYDFDGTSFTEPIPDPDFQGLLPEHWYRWSITFAFDSNRILEVNVTDLETGETLTHLPSERYLRGGAAGGLDIPTGFRFFGQANGNTMAFDNLLVEEATTDGACCLIDATCVGEVSSAACGDLGGIFQGFATTCGGVECFELGPDGWLVTAPFTWRDDSCGGGSACDLGDSDDVQWEITLPLDGVWTFSVCDATFDTVLHLGSAACLADIASNDDFPGCETASVIADIELEAGTYYLTLEGFSTGSCGDFELVVELTDCLALPDKPDAIDEGEAICEDEFVDTVNGGCNLDPPLFSTMECGGVYEGTVGANFFVAGVENRDLDWYLLEVPAGGGTTPVTVSVVGDFAEDLVVFVLDTNDDLPTICDATPTLSVVTTNQCAVNETSLDLDPGIYMVILTTNFGSANCGSGYQATITCGDACAPSPDGDLNGDGFTDFTDLLTVLANFGTAGPAGDADCNGAVEFTDLLIVLANWNPAP